MPSREPPITASIVVVNHNGRHWLERCLPAAIAQLTSDDELIVVDNGSTDDSLDFVARAFPAVRVLALPNNEGFAGGNNVGARAARGRYIAFLNNDASPCGGWLASLKAVVERDPSVGLVASRIVFMNDPSVVDSAGDGLARWGGAFKRAHGCSIEEGAQATEVFGACGAACLVRRDAFLEVGGFDDAFFAVYEDVDLSYRLQLREVRCIYAPDAVVHHAGSATLGMLSARSVFWGQRNMEWMYFKNTPWPLLVLTLPGHFLYDLAAALHFARLRLFRTFVAAKWSAVRELPRVLRQRREVQDGRRSTSLRLWRLMERRWITTKLREKRFDVKLAGGR